MSPSHNQPAMHAAQQHSSRGGWYRAACSTPVPQDPPTSRGQRENMTKGIGGIPSGKRLRNYEKIHHFIAG